MATKTYNARQRLARQARAVSGSYGFQGRTPQVGEAVYFLGGQMADRVERGTVAVVHTDYRYGYATLDVVRADGSVVHCYVEHVFDHRPHLVEVVDAFGPVKVWR